MPRVVANKKEAVRRKAPATNNNEEEPIKKQARVVFELPIPKRSKITGKALVCGQGDMGQLGLGEDEMERKRPALVPSINNIVEVCAGGMHNLCLTVTGELYSFGCNDEGALGRDSSEEGSEFLPKSVTLPGKCVKISAGDSHSGCLLEDGRVFAWGSFRDSHGNMGLTLEGNKRLPIEVLPGVKSCDIASGVDHLVILTCNGRVFTVGCGEQGQLGRVSLRSASGESRRGKTELLQPKEVNTRARKQIEAIWASSYCTFLKPKNSTTVWAFGLNNYKQLGYDKSIETVINPIDTHFDNVKHIAGGQHHTLVLTNDKKCYSIGRYDYGRLGLADVKADIKELQLISSLKNVTKIACGESQSFAVTEDGKLYSWGMGSNLQLGTGSEDDELVPTLIVSQQTRDKNILSASSGGQHSIFLVEDEIQGAEIITAAAKAVNKKTNPLKVAADEKLNGEEVNPPNVATDDEKLNGEGDQEEMATNENQAEEADEPQPESAPKVAAKRGRKKK